MGDQSTRVQFQLRNNVGFCVKEVEDVLLVEFMYLVMINFLVC